MAGTINGRDEEVIVSAAVKTGDTIITGVRHHDRFMEAQIIRLGLDRKCFTQGFVTNKFRFVDRKEAWEIAQRNHQLCWGQDREPGELFSEDLY
ncbi:MAG: hypothetical protein ABSG53_15425 [Thermoguttaceae bacterium]|jgi:hypothetical protein